MNSEIDIKLRRDWVWTDSCQIGNSVDNLDSFTVMNYNILADCHVKEDWYPYCPRDCFKMADRHRQLMAEIRYHKPDVICFQEVGIDYFNGRLNPAMATLGYLGSFFCKVKGVQEGEATFYQRERFHKVEERFVLFYELVKQECQKANLSQSLQERVLAYTDREHLVILTKLQDACTKRIVSIGNTHLLFDDFKNMDIISLQAGLAINALIEFAGGIYQPHILCGDFNQEPNMTGYQLLHDGKLNVDGEKLVREYTTENDELNESLLDVLPWCFQHPSTSLQSAYKAVLGHEVSFSCFEEYSGAGWSPKKNHEPGENGTGGGSRVRPRKMYTNDPSEYGSRLYIATLDYQWFSSSSLRCNAVLDMVWEEDLLQLYACPNQSFPSDHLSQLTRYEFIV
ncbi:uncharacterized protein [Diadema antillarum]|uniref:uncharacterized protein n=1 Tax=Diadema antillarum TaxID=105358 RepID=UPI003A8BEBD6